jgi:hypothetical protein
MPGGQLYGFKVPESQVFAVPTPAPTGTHFPIPHERFVEEVIHKTENTGLTVVNRQYALARDGAQLFGVLDCEGWQGGDGDYLFSVGLRNSHDKSLAAGLAAGTHVMVCDNLSFSAERVIKSKHTRGLEARLPSLIDALIISLRLHGKQQDLVIGRMKDSTITDRDAGYTMLHVIRQGAFPPSKLSKVVEQWDEPTFEQFADRTLWSLFNAFTFVNCRERSAQNQINTDLMAAMLTAHPFLTENVIDIDAEVTG